MVILCSILKSYCEYFSLYLEKYIHIDDIGFKNSDIIKYFQYLSNISNFY